MEHDVKITAEEVGTIAERVDITAEQVALRDLHIHNNSSPLFSSVNLNPYSQDHYISPKFTSELVSQLEEEKIIILSGGLNFDKSAFMRHLASQLKNKKAKPEVKELRNHDSDLISFTRKFIEEETPTIYLLDETHPQFLDYDLKKFRKIADKNGHYLIVSTDVAIQNWELSDHLKKLYWFDIPDSGLYSIHLLRSHLIGLLEQNGEIISITPPVSNTDLLFDYATVEEIASELDTPSQIDLFIELLVKETHPVNQTRVAFLIKEVTDHSESTIIKWYRSLTPKNQLIALGATILEGMYDDQFFSVMQVIVQKFWQYRDSSLLALDYCDLDFLHQYFELEDIHEEKKVLRLRYPSQRTELLRCAWNSYRRHILSSLPELVEMVMHTVRKSELNWEKYGTVDRRMVLRQTVSATLSDAGIVSYNFIESSLLELSSVSEITVQRVPALAMARWRKYGKDQLLYNTLDEWLSNNERVIGLMKEYLHNDKFSFNRRLESKAISYIKATSVLALGYAAAFDSPNKLDHRIIYLFKKTVSDNDPLVKSRVKEALPRIIHHHIKQLKDTLIEDFVIYDDLQESIGEGLSKAYYDYPQEIKATINYWYSRCVDQNSSDNRRKKLTHRDKVITTVLETYRKILFTETEEDVISLTEVLDQLVQLKQSEGRYKLRKAIKETAADLVMKHFKTGAPYLTRLFDYTSLGEKESLLKVLVDIYINQRQQSISSHTIIINDVSIPAWIENKSRPLTDVETLVLQWTDSTNPILKKLGASAFLKFIDILDYQETIELKNLKNELAQQESESNDEENKINPRSTINHISEGFYVQQVHRILPFWKRVHIFFFFILSPKEERNLFKDVFRSIFFHPEYQSNYKVILLDRWKRSSNPFTQKLTRWHQRFLN